jgi:hypothetical protein
MSKSKRKYSRPYGHVDKIYPKAMLKMDPKGKSLVTKTETLGFVLNPGEAAKLSVALMNALGMMTKKHDTINLTIRLDTKAFTVTLGD